MQFRKSNGLLPLGKSEFTNSFSESVSKLFTLSLADRNFEGICPNSGITEEQNSGFIGFGVNSVDESHKASITCNDDIARFGIEMCRVAGSVIADQQVGEILILSKGTTFSQSGASAAELPAAEKEKICDTSVFEFFPCDHFQRFSAGNGKLKSSQILPEAALVRQKRSCNDFFVFL